MDYHQVSKIFDLNSFDEIFTVVRNPLNRFLSEFAMRNSEKNFLSSNEIEFF